MFPNTVRPAGRNGLEPLIFRSNLEGLAAVVPESEMIVQPVLIVRVHIFVRYILEHIADIVLNQLPLSTVCHGLCQSLETVRMIHGEGNENIGELFVVSHMAPHKQWIGRMVKLVPFCLL